MPQHDGLDELLTVREHLSVYARVKGVPSAELGDNIATAMALTDLTAYADRAAGALSGGNKRKLSLALALMGNPRLYLLDELSSGVDAMTKRVLWKTLRRVGHGRAILMTTHSMEEVDALAGRLAIQSGRLLAIGTVASLRERYPCYEIQLAAQLGADAHQLADFVHAHFPHARASDAASSRFEVPLDAGTTVASIYTSLHNDAAGRASAGVLDYVVQPISLEALFLRIVRGET